MKYLIIFFSFFQLLSCSSKKSRNIASVNEDPDLTSARKGHYEDLVSRFREIEFENDSKSWSDKAYLLDEIDRLVAQTKNHPEKNRLHPVIANIPTQDPRVFSKKGTIPLISYNNLKKASDLLEKIGPGSQLPDLVSNLPELLIPEYSKTSLIVELTTTTSWLNPLWIGSSDIVTRTLTNRLGKSNKKTLSQSNVIEQIASFSVGLNIPPGEIVPYRKNLDDKTFDFVYRGPTYLFGKRVDQFTTLNGWFARDLTPQARKDYLTKVDLLERFFSEKLGKSPFQRTVISNSDSRIRFKYLPRGSFHRPIQLTGKVLSPNAQLKALRYRDNPAYYDRKYQFSLMEIFGRANLDDTKMGHRLIPARILRRLKGKNLDTAVYMAQNEILSGIYRTLNRLGATQVIQRLAPNDIHNYVAPIAGRPLSNLDAVIYLQNITEKIQKEVQKSSPKIAKALEYEIASYNDLAHIFESQEQRLGRPSQATIDIYGTNVSVSANAIKNRSNILAQNDRKVMLYLHQDGGFSVHIFIGATGVNRVDVDPKTAFYKQGDRTGDMQFGPDIYDASSKHNFKKARDYSTRDGLQKIKQGEYLGTFPPNGSTVISYYTNEFTPVPQIQRFHEVGHYQEKAGSTGIEIKSNMGDPLLIRKEAMAAILLNSYGREKNNAPTQRFLALNPQDAKYKWEREYIQNFQKLLIMKRPHFLQRRTIRNFKRQYQ